MTGPRILVVDDESGVRRVTRRLLELEGYRVVEAPDAPSALDALAHTSAGFDIVIIDQRLPGPSGTELALELRRRQPDLPLILVSAYPMHGTERPGPELANVPCLQKPYLVGDLLAALQQARATPAAETAGGGPSPLRYRIDSERGLVYVTGGQPATFAEWHALVEQAVADPAFRPGFNFVRDGRELGVPPSPDYVLRMVTYIAGRAASLGVRRWAVVAPHAAVFATARRSRALLAGSAVDIEAFRDLAAAERWALGGVEPDAG